MAGYCVTISPEYRRRLVVMVKEPRPGRVKTRLARDIGTSTAAWWFRHQCNSLIRNLRDPRWQFVLAVSPDREGLQSRVWPADLSRQPQGRGDLGNRMAAIFDAMGKGPVLIIGADIPEIQKSHIARAFVTLGSSDAVFGPATDGGYWLVGLKRIRPRPPDLFANVRWSSKHALADSMATLPGYWIALVDSLSDVDSASDL